MNKKVMVLISILAVAMLSTTSISSAQAKITEINPGIGFTEYYGSIGGANFYVLIPDDWTTPMGDERMLVILCRGVGYAEDPRDYMGGAQYAGAIGLAQAGIAAAATSYGSKGFDPKFGVIRTHQLTEFVIDNYGVTGKVFLWGGSLGGSVALVLGESYPDVYSGVLDVIGVKDWAMEYNHLETLSQSSDPFLANFGMSMLDMADNYGGTPSERPKKYTKYSATSHTDLAIPVISVVHLNDQIVPYEQTTYYHSLVGDTWHVVATITVDTPGPSPWGPSWYGHLDPLVDEAWAIYFGYLVAWSNGMISPSLIPTTYPFP
jgi:hypothetical protein